MKGGGGVVSSPKRRWRGFVVAVLGLVFLSMLVPLVFLLGLHNSFHSGNGFGEQRKTPPSHLPVYNEDSVVDNSKDSKVHESTRVDELIRRLDRTLPKDYENSSVEESRNDTSDSTTPVNIPKQVKQDYENSSVKESRNDTSDSTTPVNIPKQVKQNNEPLVVASMGKNGAGVGADESEMICELKYGSYCLWRREQKEQMGDAVVRRMKDLLFVARAYYPSIAKLPKFDQLSHELKQTIQDFERILSETTTDKDLPPGNKQRIVTMEAVIKKSKSCPVDCNNVEKKFRQLADLTEDEANFHMKQSAFLFKVAVQTMPKGLHCLSMRLTVDCFRSSLNIEQGPDEKFSDPDLYHYVIFSKNILASSVVINSTVLHTKESEKLVFHLLTDQENYFAMKLWFFGIKYGAAAVQVLNVEDLKLHNHHTVASSHLSLPEEFRISFHTIDSSSSAQFRTHYLSMFSHTHYLLPKIFRSLDRVMVLGDDIVVQGDLSGLWNLDMGDKVIGAKHYCAVKLSQLKVNVASANQDENSCAWTSGVNIVDLSRWRRHNLSEVYQRLLQEINQGGLDETATLRASLGTFEDLVYPLEDGWMLSGLGYNFAVDRESLDNAAVLHFDGSMKPWLEVGISKYKRLWRKYLDPQNQYLNDCNIN